MKPSWRYVAPLFMWLAIVLSPHPAGLSQNGWNYLGLFAGVVVALELEPLPPAAVGLIGVTTATMLGLVIPKPADAIKWGLSGFSDGTVWLIFGALTLSTGYEKTGPLWPQTQGGTEHVAEHPRHRLVCSPRDRIKLGLLLEDDVVTAETRPMPPRNYFRMIRARAQPKNPSRSNSPAANRRKVASCSASGPASVWSLRLKNCIMAP
jgi:hypothetical protein